MSNRKNLVAGAAFATMTLASTLAWGGECRDGTKFNWSDETAKFNWIMTCNKSHGGVKFICSNSGACDRNFPAYPMPGAAKAKVDPAIERQRVTGSPCGSGATTQRVAEKKQRSCRG